MEVGMEEEDLVAAVKEVEGWEEGLAVGVKVVVGWVVAVMAEAGWEEG